MTVVVNGAGRLVPFRVNSSSKLASRLVVSVRSTVRGSRRRLVVAESPCASVAVSLSSRCDGYSWSGATKLPEARLGKLWIGCEWQFDGQWLRTRSQSSECRPSAPCSGSTAEPANLIFWSTCQRNVESGFVIVGTGGLLPTSIVSSAVPSPPRPSETSSPTGCEPSLSKVWVIDSPLASSYWPSSSRSQAKLSGSSSGSLEPPPSSSTVSGAGPRCGVASIAAVGAWFAIE